LDEGLEETLTLHHLGVFSELGVSFKTTNCIESLNSLIGQYTGRVKSWKNSDQRQRWVASALLEVEPWLRAQQVQILYANPCIYRANTAERGHKSLFGWTLTAGRCGAKMHLN
jgi:hypothetical protein